MCSACEEQLEVLSDASQSLNGDFDVIFVNSAETGDASQIAEQVAGFPVAADIAGVSRNGLLRELTDQELGSRHPSTAFYDSDGALLLVTQSEYDQASFEAELRQLRLIG